MSVGPVVVVVVESQFVDGGSRKKATGVRRWAVG